MRVKHSIPIEIIHDDAKTSLFSRRDTPVVDLLGHNEALSGSLALAEGASFSLPLAQFTQVSGVLLVYEGDAAVQVDSGNTFAMRRGLTTQVGARSQTCTFFCEALVTTVVVTAVTSGKLTWAAWGDPAVAVV